MHIKHIPWLINKVTMIFWYLKYLHNLSNSKCYLLQLHVQHIQYIHWCSSIFVMVRVGDTGVLPCGRGLKASLQESPQRLCIKCHSWRGGWDSRGGFMGFRGGGAVPNWLHHWFANSCNKLIFIQSATLRAYCSQSELLMLKICESNMCALFLYNCTPNMLCSAVASMNVV